MGRPFTTESRARAGILSLASLDLVGFGMLIPSVQLRAERLGARGWLIGALLSSMFVVQTIASPLWGSLSDRVGRKPVVLACTALSAISMLVYAQASSVWVILPGGCSRGSARRTSRRRRPRWRTPPLPSAEPRSWGRRGPRCRRASSSAPRSAASCPRAGERRWSATWPPRARSSGSSRSPSCSPRSSRAPRRGSGRKRGAPSPSSHTTVFCRPCSGWRRWGWFALACLEGTFGRLMERNFGRGRRYSARSSPTSRCSRWECRPSSSAPPKGAWASDGSSSWPSASRARASPRCPSWARCPRSSPPRRCTPSATPSSTRA